MTFYSRITIRFYLSLHMENHFHHTNATVSYMGNVFDEVMSSVYSFRHVINVLCAEKCKHFEFKFLNEVAYGVRNVKLNLKFNTQRAILSI